MQIQHIYWIAGFLDGEGYFGMANGSPTIQVGVTDRDLLEKFRIYANLNNNVYKYDYKREKVSAHYRVILHGSIAIQWMMTLYSLMCERRKEKIRGVLDTWKSQNVKNGSKTHCKNGHLLYGSNLILEANMTGIGRRCKACTIKNKRDRQMRNILRKEAQLNA